MLVAFISPVKFSKSDGFSSVKFRAKFEVLCTMYKNHFGQSLRITRNQTFSTTNLVAHKEEIR